MERPRKPVRGTGGTMSKQSKRARFYHWRRKQRRLAPQLRIMTMVISKRIGIEGKPWFSLSIAKPSRARTF